MNSLRFVQISSCARSNTQSRRSLVLRKCQNTSLTEFLYNAHTHVGTIGTIANEYGSVMPTAHKRSRIHSIHRHQMSLPHESLVCIDVFYYPRRWRGTFAMMYALVTATSDCGVHCNG